MPRGIGVKRSDRSEIKQALGVGLGITRERRDLQEPCPEQDYGQTALRAPVKRDNESGQFTLASAEIVIFYEMTLSFSARTPPWVGMGIEGVGDA